MTERGEAEIRMDAMMRSLVAQLESLKTQRMAMEAANAAREDRGYAQAYGEEAFDEITAKMDVIAKELAETI